MSLLGILGTAGVGAGISALGSLFGSKVNNDANLRAVREQNKANMELAKYKYDRDVEMWNMQNEYNTPSAQMARFAQAGLNPNFMYGQGTAGNATSAPSYETPTINAYTQQDYGIGAAAAGGFDAYMKAITFENQNRVSNSVIAKNNADAAGQLIQNSGLLIDNARKEFDLGILKKYRADQIESTLAQTYANIRNLSTTSDLNEVRTMSEGVRTELLQQQVSHEIEKTNLTRVQKALVYSQISHISANIKKIGEEVTLLQERQQLTREQAIESVLNQQFKYVSNDILRKTGTMSAVSKIIAPFIP